MSILEELLEIRKECTDVMTYDRLTELIERLENDYEILSVEDA